MNVLDMMVGIHAGRTLTILCIVCFGQDGILSVMSGLGNIASYQNLILIIYNGGKQNWPFWF